MITPRQTELLRVPDLPTFQRTLVNLIPDDPFAARFSIVIVPSEGSAEAFRRTFENVTLIAGSSTEPRVRVLPAVLTRERFYARLAERLPGAPRFLDEFQREVLLRRASREASAEGAAPPFCVRAGLIVEMLALYDDLRRRNKTVADFERLLVGALEPGAAYDRGAERLLQQTRFLVSTFSRFEEAVTRTGLADEHTLRALVLQSAVPLVRHVMVAVPDRAADRRGLWPADFDLLARLPHLERLQVVATEALLASGFHQRLHDALPGMDEIRVQDGVSAPILMVPPSSIADDPVSAFMYRDREEEVAGMARLVKADSSRSTELDRTALVFQRPLPYLYLAREVFTDAGIPYQALDSLPLAAEPFAATVDVILAAIGGNFTRGRLLELLRCSHLTFQSDLGPISRAEIAALDQYLVERKFLGGAERLAELAEEIAAAKTTRRARSIAPTLRAAARATAELQSAATAETSTAQIQGVIDFLLTHERYPNQNVGWYARHVRARAAVLSGLEMLRDAHAHYDTEPLTIGELTGAVRRWIESRTFSPRLGTTGLQLLDASAARFADIDEARIAGLVEGDWPERTSRSIFYPQELLSQLGWPAEQDRLAAARAYFFDLLRLPRHRVSLSTFHLEDDAPVSPSPLLVDLDAAGLRAERLIDHPAIRIFTHDALALDPIVESSVTGGAAEWLAVRVSRSCNDDRFHGIVGPRASTAYAVSRIERYLDCPFRYFAAHVLGLPEERDEEAWMTPQERGQFVHEVFSESFDEWQRLGFGGITPLNVREAVALFERVAERRLALLPETDRALERTLLLGSAAAPGLAERAFAFEIEHEVPVLERLLEYELEGTFRFLRDDEEKAIEIRAKADRIDLLADGTLRIVDYKLGRAPNRDRSLQLPVYGACAVQKLEGRHGRAWTISRAGYVAFREKQPFVPLGRNSEELAEALGDGQKRLVDAVDGIEAGRFPPQPAELFLCNWCAYPSVCRKDYVGDD